MIDYKSLMHHVPNFPKPGIMFYDITPVLRTNFASLITDVAALLTYTFKCFSEVRHRVFCILLSAQGEGL